MANIRIDLDTPVLNGQAVTFKSPVASADISGLVVYYPDGSSVTSKTFKLVDAHGQDVGSGTIRLFAANVLVRVILDIDAAKAYVQNADTNAYLEGELAKKYSPSNKPTAADIGAVATAAGSDNEGKFLRVVGGVATWAAISNAEGGSF